MQNIAEIELLRKEKTCKGCIFLKKENWAKDRIAFVCERGWGEYAGRTVLTIREEFEANAEISRPKWCQDEK